MPEPFRFSSGHVAYTVADLIGVCNQSPQEIIYHLKRGDFEKWLAYIGETEIAKKVEEVSKLSVTEEELLKQFIQVLQPPQPENTISESSDTVTPSEQDSSTTELDNTDSQNKTVESDEPSPTTELKDNTLEVSEAKQSTATAETSDGEETINKQSEIEEKTTIETTESSDGEETINKQSEIDAKNATETTVKPEVIEETKEPKKPIAPLNESSDEGVEANSSFAKAVQGFMSNYINKE
ncbi:MAG: hypothetical protein AB4057_22300 [Crocosphaera sp.]